MYNLIEIKESPIEGKGIFAKINLKKDIELTCNVLVLNSNIILSKYIYPWDNNQYSICMDFGSFFYHSSSPNVRISKIDKKKINKNIYLIKKY